VRSTDIVCDKTGYGQSAMPFKRISDGLGREHYAGETDEEGQTRCSLRIFSPELSHDHQALYGPRR
jgi:hypothetical protein